MKCNTCEFFEEAKKGSMFWLQVTKLEPTGLESRYLSHTDFIYCPTCGKKFRGEKKNDF